MAILRTPVGFTTVFSLNLPQIDSLFLMKSDLPNQPNRASKSSRIVIVDPHVASRQLLEKALSNEQGLAVVGHAGSGCEALRACRALKPDLVVLELVLGDLQGLRVMRSLRELLPCVRLVVYTGSTNDEVMREALEGEPAGFVRKVDDWSDLRRAIETAAEGGRFVSPRAVFLKTQMEEKKPVLTEREKLVLELIAAGLLTKEIAEVLDVKVRTVDHYRQNIMDKLGLHDTPALIRHWLVEMRGGVGLFERH